MKTSKFLAEKHLYLAPRAVFRWAVRAPHAPSSRSAPRSRSSLSAGLSAQEKPAPTPHGNAGLQLRRVARAAAGVRDRQGRQGRARPDRRRLRGAAGRAARRGRLVPLRRHDRRGRAGRAQGRFRRAAALPAAVRQVVHRPAGPRPRAARGGRLRAPPAGASDLAAVATFDVQNGDPRGRELHRGPRATEPRDRDARRAEPRAHQRSARPRGGPGPHGPAGLRRDREPRRAAPAGAHRQRGAGHGRPHAHRRRAALQHNVSMLLDGLDAWRAALRGVEGRKQVLYFSAGFDARVLVGQCGRRPAQRRRGGDARAALGGGQPGPLRRQPRARGARRHDAQPGGRRHRGALDRRHRPRRRPLAARRRRQPGPRPRHHEPRVARLLRARDRRAALRQRQQPRARARRDARDDEPLLRARDPARPRDAAGQLPQAQGEGGAQGREALAPARLLREERSRARSARRCSGSSTSPSSW